MKIQHVRNATLKIEFGGQRFLIDPMLAKKGAFPPFPGAANSDSANPLVELPISIEEIIYVDVVPVTHTHPDHWDDAAKSLIPKKLTIFAQHEQDRDFIRSSEFKDVRLLSESSEFSGVQLIKTPGKHGTDEQRAKIRQLFGEIMDVEVCGIVFKHPTEKTLYLAGDSIWDRDVQDNLTKYTPDVIIFNSGDARVSGVGSILMGKHEVYEVYKAAPHATIICVHMEAVNHCMQTRKDLREFSVEKGMTNRVLVPEDGEVYSF